MYRPQTPPSAAGLALRTEPMERVGRVVAVTGAHAVILIDQERREPGTPPEKGPEIGTLLKVDTPRSISLAMISALSSPMPSHNPDERELRIVEVEFIGELPKDADGRAKSFRRGISSYPSLGDIVFRASKSELEKAYACDTDTAIRVGHIQQDATIPAMIKIDEMLGKHFAVLGTTGTGKSCTVALILRRIIEKNPQAHVLLLDVHREYAQSFKDLAEVITPDNMNLPFWLLNFDEIVEILIGQQPNRETDVEVLRELIPLAKVRYMSNQRRDRAGQPRSRDYLEASNIGVDTPIPYRTSDLTGLLEEYIGKLELRGELAPYKRLKSRVETITRDPRYAFMFGGLTVQDTMSQVLARLFRIPVAGKPIAILELGGLPSEIINVVVSVLGRLAFDFALWSGGRVPLTFVSDQAGDLAHRQGRPQIRRVAVHRHPAPGRTRSHHPVAVQYHFLHASHQRARPADPAGRHFRRRRQPARIHVNHGHRRSHHLRRRRCPSHPHQVRHAARRFLAAQQYCLLHQELGDRSDRRELPHRYRQPLAGPEPQPRCHRLCGRDQWHPAAGRPDRTAPNQPAAASWQWLQPVASGTQPATAADRRQRRFRPGCGSCGATPAAPPAASTAAPDPAAEPGQPDPPVPQLERRMAGPHRPGNGPMAPFFGPNVMEIRLKVQAGCSTSGGVAVSTSWRMRTSRLMAMSTRA
ncbi:MAG: ATP-binding protein [Rhizobiales bacterium]|nr:ATP-binding protein [Hyphomicrobiales bacterium]